MTDKETLIGKSIPRSDAWDKVTGKAKYVADLQTEAMQYGVVLRSTEHHALVRKIDTTAAKNLPGIIAIITIEDVKGSKYYGPINPDRPILAHEKVRFVGEPVAIVVAKTLAAAESARAAIQVTYETLAPVFDPIQAIQSGAPAIHPDGNLLAHFEIEEGDPEKGFAEADVIVEQTFEVPRIYPGYLEPEASLAEWHPDGHLTVWVSSQKPFNDRDQICHVLGLPVGKVQVKSATIGGAFGGKEDSNLAILAALAAWKTQSTVKLVNTREESFLAHPKRHPATLTYKAGAKKDGTLVAMKVVSHMNTGAYGSYGIAVSQLHTETLIGPYRIPNVRLDTYLVYTNSPISGAMRGFGAPQSNFGYEGIMDILAARLGIDPITFREKNIWRPGDRNVTRALVNQPESLQTSLDLVREEIKRLKQIPPAPGMKSGVGFALSVQTMGLGHRVPDDSTNRLEWLPDGKVLIRIGAPDLGQGLNTVAAQMTAEALGLPLDQVEVAGLDTFVSPDGGVTCASRMTYCVGNSLLMASQKAISALVNAAAELLHVDPGNIQYHNGHLLRLDQPGSDPVPAAEITSRTAEAGRVLSGEATFSFPYGPETPDHLPVGMPHVKFCMGAQLARVEVDPDLGTVKVKEIVAIHDLGKVINRVNVEGQIEGGVVMGVGFAVTEEMRLKADQRWISNLTEYLLPTSMDAPPVIKSILLEYPEESGPFGVKGIGEIPLVPTPAAIISAVENAVGVRLTSAPIKREDLLTRIS